MSARIDSTVDWTMVDGYLKKQNNVDVVVWAQGRKQEIVDSVAAAAADQLRFDCTRGGLFIVRSCVRVPCLSCAFEFEHHRRACG